jgi:hypothetical protein
VVLWHFFLWFGRAFTLALRWVLYPYWLACIALDYAPAASDFSLWGLNGAWIAWITWIALGYECMAWLDKEASSLEGNHVLYGSG